LVPTSVGVSAAATTYAAAVTNCDGITGWREKVSVGQVVAPPLELSCYIGGAIIFIAPDRQSCLGPNRMQFWRFYVFTNIYRALYFHWHSLSFLPLPSR